MTTKCNFCDNSFDESFSLFKCNLHSKICKCCLLNQISSHQITIEMINESTIELKCNCKSTTSKNPNTILSYLNDINVIQKEKQKCKVHNEVAEFYCKKCKMIVCEKCKEHIDHRRIYVNDLIEKINKNISHLKYKTYKELETVIEGKQKELNIQIDKERDKVLNEINDLMIQLTNVKNQYSKAIIDKKNKINFSFEFIKRIHQFFYSCLDNLSNTSIQTIVSISKGHIFQKASLIDSSRNNLNNKLSSMSSLLEQFSQCSPIQVDIVFKKYIASKKKISKQLIRANSLFRSTSLATNNKLSNICTLSGHSNCVYCIIELSNGNLASCSSDTKIIIWQKSDKKFTLSFVLSGHSQRVNCLIETPSQKLISTSADYSIKIWNLHTRKVEHTLNGHYGNVSSCILLPDNRLASSSWDATIIVWNLSTFREEFSFQAQANSIGSLVSIGNRQLCSSIYRSIIIWNYSTRERENTILNAHDKCINCIVLLKDAQRIASCSDDKTIKIWTLSSKQCLCTFNGHEEAVYCLIELSDGTILSGSQDKSVRIWSIEERRELSNVHAHKYTVRAVAQLRDGRICTGSWDSTIKLWYLLKE